MSTPAMSSAQIMADPNVQKILADPRYSTPQLRDAAVNDYLFNDPRSPMAGMNTGVPVDSGKSLLHFDPQTRQLTSTPYGGQHWYTDPGIVGPIAVGVASGGLGFLGSGGSSGGAAVGSLNPTIDSLMAGGGAASGAGMSTSGFGSGILGKIFGSPQIDSSLINGIMGLLGTGMQTSANSKAAEMQAQTAQQALDFLKQQYATSQAQFKPYLDAGTGAVGNLTNMVNHLPDPMAMSGLPGRANGGPVDPNQPYVVGENGPEIVVPNQGGTVVPNGIGDQISAEYQRALGRAPTSSELASEMDNANRYGFDTGPYGGIKAQIDKRAVNTPGGAPMSGAQVLAAPGQVTARSAAVPQMSMLASQPGTGTVAPGSYGNDVFGTGLTAPNVGGFAPGMSSGGMGGAVTLKSPTGQTKQFQAGDPAIQHYLDQGAVRV